MTAVSGDRTEQSLKDTRPDSELSCEEITARNLVGAKFGVWTQRSAISVRSDDHAGRRGGAEPITEAAADPLTSAGSKILAR